MNLIVQDKTNKTEKSIEGIVYCVQWKNVVENWHICSDVSKIAICTAMQTNKGKRYICNYLGRTYDYLSV